MYKQGILTYGGTLCHYPYKDWHWSEFVDWPRFHYHFAMFLAMLALLFIVVDNKPCIYVCVTLLFGSVLSYDYD